MGPFLFMRLFNKEDWEFGPDSKMVILTGAGISEPSGIPTFRTGEDALWLNYPVEEIAYPRGLESNREQFIEFYNKARKMTSTCVPNKGHDIINELQEEFGAYLITQNIDDLHERAGSYQVTHMHGSLFESVCQGEYEHIFQEPVTQVVDKPCPHCYHLLRPNVTLFTEEPQYMDEIYDKLDECTHLVLVGTSGEVYPAAEFKKYVGKKRSQRSTRRAKVLNINIDIERDKHVQFYLQETAVDGLNTLYNALI